MDTNNDIILRLEALKQKWYWAHREAAETIHDAIVEIKHLRLTPKSSHSILDNPHAGVTGWGKGSDE
jgi:hypothetical protein